jgi:hypothetical protein
MPKPYVVHLSEHQRGQLYALIQKGHASARTIHRAHTLLLAYVQQPLQTIAAMLHTSAVTVTRRASGSCTPGWRPSGECEAPNVPKLSRRAPARSAGSAW